MASSRWGAPTSEHVSNAIMMANLLAGRELMAEVQGTTAVLDDSVGDMVQHLGSGRAVGELELLSSLQHKSSGGAGGKHGGRSTTIAVALQDTAMLRISADGYHACLEAYRSQQLAEHVSFFQQSAVCVGMRLQDIMAMSSAIVWTNVPRDAVLLEAGSQLQGVFFVRSGQVAVLLPAVRVPGGSCSAQLNALMRQVAVLGPGDHFGEDALTNGGIHEVTVVAEAASTVGWLRPANTGVLEEIALLNLMNSSRMRKAWREKHMGVRNATLKMLGMTTDQSNCLPSPSSQLPNSNAMPPTLLQQQQGKKTTTDCTGCTLDMSIYEAWLGPLEALMIRRREAAQIEQRLHADRASQSEAVTASLPTTTLNAGIVTGQISPAASTTLSGMVTPRKHGIPLEPWHESQLSPEQQLKDQQVLEQCNEVISMNAQKSPGAAHFRHSALDGRRNSSMEVSAALLSPVGSLGHSLEPVTKMSLPRGSLSHGLGPVMSLLRTSLCTEAPKASALRAGNFPSNQHGKSGRKTYAYSGLRQGTTELLPHDHADSLYGLPTHQNVQGSAAALALASSFAPHVSVQVCAGMREPLMQVPVREPSHQAYAHEKMRDQHSQLQNIASLKPRSEDHVLAAQAGLPVKGSPRTNLAGSLVGGWHYSSADVTSYRWRELHSEVPQQASFMNRVEILKAVYYNNIQ